MAVTEVSKIIEIVLLQRDDLVRPGGSRFSRKRPPRNPPLIDRSEVPLPNCRSLLFRGPHVFSAATGAPKIPSPGFVIASAHHPARFCDEAFHFLGLGIHLL